MLKEKTEKENPGSITDSTEATLKTFSDKEDVFNNVQVYLAFVSSEVPSYDEVSQCVEQYAEQLAPVLSTGEQSLEILLSISFY